MTNQNSMKPFMVGSVCISDLEGFLDTEINGMRGCFIPYDMNPCIFLGQYPQTGRIKVNVDILMREVSNSKSGSSHFIKLNVGKMNRERFRMTQEAVDAQKIVGNMFTRVPGQRRRGAQHQAAVPGGYQQHGPAHQVPAGGYQPPMGGAPLQQGQYNGFGGAAAPKYPQMSPAAGW